MWAGPCADHMQGSVQLSIAETVRCETAKQRQRNGKRQSKELGIKLLGWSILGRYTTPRTVPMYPCMALTLSRPHTPWLHAASTQCSHSQRYRDARPAADSSLQGWCVACMSQAGMSQVAGRRLVYRRLACIQCFSLVSMHMCCKLACAFTRTQYL